MLDRMKATWHRAARRVMAWRWYAADRLVTLCRHRAAYAAAAVVAAMGCAPNALVHDWKSPTYTGAPLERVLVLSASADPELRRVYEDAFVQELAAMGVTATAAHAVIQDGPVSSERIAQAVEEVRANGVLLTRMIGKERGARSYVPPPLRAGADVGLYATYESGMTLATPLQRQDYQVYALETSLWEVPRSTLLWFSTSQSFQADMAFAAAKDLADVVVKAMRQHQLL